MKYRDPITQEYKIRYDEHDFDDPEFDPGVLKVEAAIFFFCGACAMALVVLILRFASIFAGAPSLTCAII